MALRSAGRSPDERRCGPTETCEDHLLTCAAASFFFDSIIRGNVRFLFRTGNNSALLNKTHQVANEVTNLLFCAEPNVWWPMLRTWLSPVSQAIACNPEKFGSFLIGY